MCRRQVACVGSTDPVQVRRSTRSVRALASVPGCTCGRDGRKRVHAAAKDYKAAKEWADLAAADAQLAHSKANTAKATSAANEVQQSVNAMRDELNRSNANQQQ